MNSGQALTSILSLGERRKTEDRRIVFGVNFLDSV
jgi:hypothetical protein